MVSVLCTPLSDPVRRSILLELAAAAEVIYVTWRQTGYRPVDPLFQGYLVLAAIFELQDVITPVLDANVVYECQLSPPTAGSLVLELVVYFCD